MMGYPRLRKLHIAPRYTSAIQLDYHPVYELAHATEYVASS